MRLKEKFFILIFSVATSIIGLEALNIWIHIHQNRYQLQIQKSNQIILKLNQAKNYHHQTMIELLQFSSESQPSDAIQTQIEELTNGFNQSLLKSKKFNGEPSLREEFEQIDRQSLNFNQIAYRYLNDYIITSYNVNKARDILPKKELIKQSQKLTQTIEKTITNQVIQLNQTQKKTQNIHTWSLYLNIISLIVGSSVIMIMGWLFAKQVANPILKLKNVALKIGQGEWDTNWEINNEDEIGILAKAFNQIVEKFKQTSDSKIYVDKIIRNINESLIVLDDTYNIKDFNFATLLMLGYEEEELLGKSIKAFFANVKDCAEILGIDDTVANSFLGTKETTLVSKDKRRIPVSFSASIMWDDQDKIEGIVCLVQDISAHKQVIETLRRQALMFETIHDGILLTDLDGNIIDCNPAAERIFGYPKSKMVGQMTGMLRYPPPPLGQEGDRAWYLTQQIIDGVLRRGRWTGEFRFIRGDGTWGVCETVVVPLRDRSNKLIATIGVNRDITERKQAEEALRKSEERLESILNSLNDIVWSMAIETKEILYLNPAIAKVYGRSVEEFLQQPSLWFDAIHPDDRQQVMDFSAEMFATGERDLEYRIVRPDGEVRWIHDRGKLTGDGQKNPLLLEGIATDITEQKQAQKLLEEAHAQLEQKVKERTAELTANNDLLLAEIRDRVAAEKALRDSEAKFKQLARQEALVNQLTEQIRNSLDLNTILKTTVQEIRSLLSVDRCVFIWYRQLDNPSKERADNPLHNQSNPQWVWQVVAEAKNSCLPSILGQYPADPSNCLTQKIQNLEILREENLAAAPDTHLHKIYQDWRYQAILALPIQTHTGNIGVISCGNFRRIQPWSDADVALLQAMTNQLAIALFQAELYSQAQTAAQQAYERAEELKETLEKLKKTQAQLIQSEKMSSLGQLVAGVAHEINNPVNFISGNITFIQDYTQDLLHLLDLYQQKYSTSEPDIANAIEDCDLDFIYDDLPQLLSSMQTGANRIREIVLSLRNFSRLDEANYKLVDLHQGIDNTLLILRHRLQNQLIPETAQNESAEIQVIKNYGDLPKVECFASLLNQVFMNILSNAIDALESQSIDSNAQVMPSQHSKLVEEAIATMPTTYNGISSPINHHGCTVDSASNRDIPQHKTLLKIPQIHIITEIRSGERVAIRIKDNGSGMSESVRQRIFDPFFTTKPVGSGTGLGLSISYQIVVEKHHGDLSCVSEPGQGTEFIIELPIHQ